MGKEVERGEEKGMRMCMCVGEARKESTVSKQASLSVSPRHWIRARK